MWWRFWRRKPKKVPYTDCPLRVDPQLRAVSAADKVCHNCKWWATGYYWGQWYICDHGHEHVRDGKPSEGLCKRNAPVGPTETGDGILTKGFPVTNRAASCGDWEASCQS